MPPRIYDQQQPTNTPVWKKAECWSVVVAFIGIAVGVVLVTSYTSSKIVLPGCREPTVFVSRNKTEQSSSLWIHRKQVMQELDAAFQQHTQFPQEEFVVVLGGAGCGKTSNIQAWLNGRPNVISVECDRDSDDQAIWGNIGGLLECDAASAERYVKSTNPILHLQVGGKKEDVQRAGSALAAIGRGYGQDAFIILDLSPRSIDVSVLLPLGVRMRSVAIPEFTEIEARDFLCRAADTPGTRSWIPPDAHQNLSAVIHNITTFLVGRNPLALTTMLVMNETFAVIRNTFEDHQANSQTTVGRLSAEERAVIEELVSAEYEDGINWRYEGAIKPAELHRFPMVRVAVPDRPNTGRLYFSSARDHVLFQQALKIVPAKITDVWVQQRGADSQPTGSAFTVTPATNDIDSLKKAIKAELGTHYTRSPALLTIYDPADPAKKVVKQSTPLAANTAKTPYLFELP